jgi:hypothetical protein
VLAEGFIDFDAQSYGLSFVFSFFFLGRGGDHLYLPKSGQGHHVRVGVKVGHPGAQALPFAVKVHRVAVDLDHEGLLVPVIRSAESKRIRAIAREINDLANRTRARKLSPDEIQGGTFSISNNGSAGSVLTMAIINQPQVAILSTDAIVRKPVVVANADGGEGIAIHPVGHLAMSWDHRAFDGAYAANFLRRVKQILETQDWSAEF